MGASEIWKAIFDNWQQMFCVATRLFHSETNKLSFANDPVMKRRDVLDPTDAALAST